MEFADSQAEILSKSSGPLVSSSGMPLAPSKALPRASTAIEKKTPGTPVISRPSVALLTTEITSK